MNHYSSSESLSDCIDRNPIENETTATLVVEDDLFDRLDAKLEALQSKSTKAKLTALNELCEAFRSRYLFDYLNERENTISDLIVKGIKRGKGEEQGHYARLAGLYTITSGVNDEADDLFIEIEPIMITLLRDESIDIKVRIQIVFALGFCCFINESGVDSIDNLMDVFYSIFSASYHKGNGVAPVHSPDIVQLHTAALQSWSLLLTIQSENGATNKIEKHLKRGIELFDSNDVDLRITAGETIALIYELRRFSACHRVKLMNEFELPEKLQNLATDSQKFRAKKERKIQRSNFREILKYIENDIPPFMMIKFGTERLEIDSWERKLQYNAFCQALGSGMNLHLARNQLIREIFNLGPVDNLLIKTIEKQQIKTENRMENNANEKARSKSRRQERDKRAAF